MKKLLSLSITLLSLNLYGAELKFSKNGLEGWGKKEGVAIKVEDYSGFDKNFDVKAIKNQVELKLRRAGIKIQQTGRDTLAASNHKGFTEADYLAKLNVIPNWISVNIKPMGQSNVIAGGRIVGYALTIKASRRMTFKYNGKEYIADGSSNHEYGGITRRNNYRPSLDKYLDKLLLDYLKANPITPKDQ